MSDPPSLIERPQGQQFEQATPVEFHIPSSDPEKPVIIKASHANKLARYSVQLRRLLEEARKSQKPFVVLKCRAGDGTNLPVLEWVLQQLPKSEADPGGDTCDAPTLCDARTLCAACNVLFRYKCLPTAFADLSTKVSPGSSARSIASERSESVRCWQAKRMVESTTELAGQLMTIALVLGNKDLFRAELATVIWRAELESLDTSVEKLVDLHAMRREELQRIYQDLKDAHHKLTSGTDYERQLAEFITHRMEAAKLGNPAHSWQDNCTRFSGIAELTPYRYIGKVENALRLVDAANGIEQHEDGSCSTDNEVQGREPPSIGLLGSIQRHVFDPLKAAISRAKEERVKLWTETVKSTLDSVETEIKNRQGKRADDLMSWRDTQVSGWERELGWRPTAPANGLARPTTRPLAA
ncbi:hypothetical protein B0T14DRAFT_605814 [Immersiella caudata]|uniref:Uncharacterized protein n=1 Tax=Immersiella caudata TaxID=314043 RepID=A0AA39WD85_9PEZI|nr:hypothetical protein B0T14DRAFT_605814 [Immersiella caudata]